MLQAKGSPSKKADVLSNEGIDDDFDDLIVKKADSFTVERKAS